MFYRKKIKELRKELNELRGLTNRLELYLKYPPKYPVGTEINGYMVAKVEGENLSFLEAFGFNPTRDNIRYTYTFEDKDGFRTQVSSDRLESFFKNYKI